MRAAESPITSTHDSGGSPLISVIMPAWNCAAFIPDAIASIVRQTHRDLELVIVDDGSIDDTLARATVLSKLDPRIRILSEGHRGLAAAINRGVEMSRGKWIAIMPADDIALPHRLQRQLAAAKENPAVVAWGGFVQHINTRKQRLGVSCTGPTTSAEFQRRLRNGEEIYVPHPTLFLRKSTLLHAGGYDPRFEGSEDLELISRLARLGEVLAIPETLVLYRVHPTSRSMTSFFQMRDRARMVSAFLRGGADAGAIDRIGIGLNDMARFCYRRSGLAFGEACPAEGLLMLLTAILLAPHYSLPRLWNQRIGRRAAKVLDLPIRL